MTGLKLVACCVGSVLAMQLGNSAVAADGQVSAASHSCAAVVERDARLECYDRSFPPDPQVRQAEAEKATREFGLAPEPRTRSEEHSPDRIEARIVKLAYGQRGERTLTLDNKQVWRIVEATSRGHMVEGDQVSVRKASMGSHLLISPGGVPLRAQRVR
ncbi:hypothetical protein ACYX7E_07870 [Luteimonas sp. RIT-PG2_3]